MAPPTAHWGTFYSHRHPDAVFVNNLVASRILPQEIRSLRNRDYRIITGSGETQRHVATAECLQEILTLQLDLCVTESETRQLFQQLP
jgi:N-hydroxyarylamine O-acetyltransferase